MKYYVVSIVAFLALSGYAISQERIPLDDPYAARKVFYENQWQQKIESALQFVDGAVVNVNVELSAEVDKSIKSLEIIGDPVAKSELTKVSLSDSEGGLAQEPGRKNDGGKHSESKEEAQTTSFIPTTESTTKLAGLVPKNISVCVTIPRSLYEELRSLRTGRVENSNKSGASLAEIESEVELEVREAVIGLLPKNPSQPDAWICDVRVISFENLRREPIDSGSLPDTQAFRVGDVITLTLTGDDSAKKRQSSSSTSVTSSERPGERIAVQIVDAKSNGCFVIEGHRTARNGDHQQKLDVRGVVHASSITPAATVSSREVADLKLTIFETSH